jgi:hypothetical protein
LRLPPKLCNRRLILGNRFGVVFAIMGFIIHFMP